MLVITLFSGNTVNYPDIYLKYLQKVHAKSMFYQPAVSAQVHDSVLGVFNFPSCLDVSLVVTSSLVDSNTFSSTCVCFIHFLIKT